METTTPNPRLIITPETIIDLPGYHKFLNDFIAEVNNHLKDLVSLFDYELPITKVHITRKDKIYFKFDFETKGWEEDEDIHGIILAFLQALTERIRTGIQDSEEDGEEIPENLWDNLFKVQHSDPDDWKRLYITISFPI